MSEEWYYIDRQEAQQGPVDFATLKGLYASESINDSTFCWGSDLPDWAAVSEIPGLLAKLKPAPQPTRPPAAMRSPPPVSKQQTTQPEPASQGSFASRAANIGAMFGAQANVRPSGGNSNAPQQQQQPAVTARPQQQQQQHHQQQQPAVAARPQQQQQQQHQSAPTPAARPTAASNTANEIKNLAAQKPQSKKLEPLGAPEPVSSGGAAQPLNIQRRAEPDHGWKALKSSDGQEYYYNAKTGTTQWEKPDALRTADDYERAGEWYWALHEVNGYVPARLITTSPDGKVQLETEDGQRLAYTAKQFQTLDSMKWLQLKQLQSDLVMLDEMNKPLILYNLKKRFEQNEIYTAIGSILISINPYKRLPLYTPAVMEEYIRRGNRKLPPHVFSIADQAYKALLESGVGQSIVISGESGAGKTECTKQALQYLAEIAGSSSNVEQKILASNPILEAFGNAKTVRNNNSSRFGKYVEIYFDNRAQISGSTNTNYLLEKIRVVKQSQNERNYHAFYQIVRGATPQQRQKYQLGNVSDYWYLNQSGCDIVDDMDDVEEHEAVLQAMHELGWKENEIEQVYQTLSGILHLGNVVFKSTGDRQCEVMNHAVLKTTCQLLELDPQAFSKAVTTRVMRIMGQEPIDVPLSKEEAEAARDALAKFIYEKMFDWIVQRINLSIGKGDNAQSATISILDIFGFEIFNHNLFEQLLINETNEKLQLFFNDHTFKLEESLYQSEGINFTHVPYIDNTPVINLIEQRPNGVIPLIDEELRMPKGSDKTFMQKLVNNHQSNKNFKQYLKNPDHFIIEHYAGSVRYDSTGFLEKNRDQLNDDAFDVLSSSKFGFLKSLFEVRTADKKISLGNKFIKQLNDLMATLNTTQPHYIRCVKPNPNKAALQFFGNMTLEQLQYAGVFEAVTIRKQGFPFRLSHDEFFRRYKCLYKDKQWDNRVIENCRFLIQNMGLSLNDVQIGSTRVLYRAEQHRVMELKRNLAVEEVTVYTQKYCRRVLTSLLRERCLQFKPILKKAIDTRSIEEVDKALAQASSIGFPIYELKQAQRFKHVFVEEQRLEKLFRILVSQDAQENYTAFETAVASADDIELKSASSNTIREMYHAAKRVRDKIIEDATKQEEVLDEVEMKCIIERADNLPSFNSEVIERLRELLYNTSEDKFVKMQLKAAVQLKDPELIQARTIRMKDLVLDKAGDMFVFKKLPLLYPPTSWADIKMLCWDRDELAGGMLSWTHNTIHATLTQIDTQAKENKEIINSAKRLFKNIQGFMGDKKQQQPVMLLVELLTECLKEPKLRDEVYCQIIKQLSNNPNPDSITKGWNMMVCCLHCFPPSQGLENYLQMFFREKANPQRKFINLMHKTAYSGAITQYPTEDTVHKWISSQDQLDCDDYKTKLAKAEARIRAQQEQDQRQNQQPQRTGGNPGMNNNNNNRPMGGNQPAPPQAAPRGIVAPPPKAAPVGPADHIEWFYIDLAGNQCGPATKGDLRSAFKDGSIDSTCYCWCESMGDWLPISTETVLFEYLKY